MERSNERLPMRALRTLWWMLIPSSLLFGQTLVATRAECTKNVSFAVTAGRQPVAAIPSFVLHSIGGDRHQQRYPGLCFTQSPDPRSRNYVVVFTTQRDGFRGLVPSVLKYVNSAPISEESALRAIYGEMWHYESNRPAAENTSALDLLHADTSTALLVRAYDEQGAVVSQLSLKDVSGWMHTKERLLDRVLGDILADSRQSTTSQVPVQASLPVYYVNCDVPVKLLAGQETASTSFAAPVAAPAQLAHLEFWSSPTGADVYLDGRLVGNTPSSFSIAPGEYTITMRKQNFGTWQRKLQIAEGKRKVSGYLEQKVVTLGSLLTQ